MLWCDDVFWLYPVIRCLGGVAVGRWTRDQEVAGSTPTAALFGQQPWTSCSHLMCLCSPSSITWYLARAFMLKAPYCWQRHRVQWTRGYCGAVLPWSSDCIEPRYESSALPFIYKRLPIPSFVLHSHSLLFCVNLCINVADVEGKAGVVFPEHLVHERSHQQLWRRL